MKFLDVNQGDIDPALGNKIEVLILKTETCIVYLDEELETQWAASASWPDYSGRIFSRVTKLESISSFITDRKRLRSIRCQIAEGVARLLDGCDESEIDSVLNDAEIEIKLRNRECSRYWFFLSALSASLVFLLPVTGLLIFRNLAADWLSETGYTIITTGLLGALGALGSVCIRSEDLRLDANAGFSLHVLEAGARVLLGVIAALVFALFVKGGLLLHVIQGSEYFITLIWGLGIIAGASERIFPGFIKKGEDLILESEK